MPTDVRGPRATRQRSIAYIPALDGLRGVAVVLVLAAHSGLRAIDGGGSVGVDIFFVLSGWLITSILIRTLRRDCHFDLRRFYLHRLIRLWPALLTTIAVVFVPAVVWVRPTSVVLKTTVAAALYLFPAVGWSVPWIGVWDHTWTLALEEWFYLAFPGSLLLLIRRGWTQRGIALVLGLLATLLLGTALVAHLLIAYPSGAIGYLQVGALAAGCCCALHMTAQDSGPSEHPVALQAVGCAFVVMAVATARSDVRLAGLSYIFATAGGLACVAGLSTSSRGPISRFLGLAPLVYLGTISYELYLYHQPLITIVATATHTSYPAASLTAYPAALLLAAGTHFAWMPVQQRLRARLDVRAKVPTAV